MGCCFVSIEVLGGMWSIRGGIVEIDGVPHIVHRDIILNDVVVSTYESSAERFSLRGFAPG